MKKDDRIYLDHILDSFVKVGQYLEDVSYEAFQEDEEKQDAIIRKIEVAGEATKCLSIEFREKYFQVPWRAIAGMRDKLIHDYFDVDLDTVWETATKDIPGLILEIESIIEELK
ncbi:MAG: DUF86 domain-containing protein [Bacteroidales bacterium]|nr:DUF86 domain-containing protein [Bacteroidales bacterium]